MKMRISAIRRQSVPGETELRYLRLEPITGETPNFDFIPGQFLMINHAGCKPGYFAIASAPGEGDYFDLLIRRGQGASGAVCDLEVGAEVEVAGPQGKGFPIEPHRGKNLLLIGVGTGIAPLRSVIRAAVKERGRYGRIMCFYGALTPQHLCFHEELGAWPEWGVETFLTVTDPNGQPWQSHVGFVQHHVGRISPSPKETVAMLVGMPEMIQENTELLRRLGFLPDAILLNY
jgi:NAD(P)H-flavin reductase